MNYMYMYEYSVLLTTLTYGGAGILFRQRARPNKPKES